jgi:hypothetical protein
MTRSRSLDCAFYAQRFVLRLKNNPAGAGLLQVSGCCGTEGALHGMSVTRTCSKSLSRPGGNVTGVTLLTNMMEPKRLGLLHELVPGAGLIGVLMNPNFPTAARQLQDLEEAARTIGRRLVISNASYDEELDAAFVSLVQEHVGALFVGSDPYFNTRRDRIVAFAAKQRLPAIYQFREYAVASGLLSYGINLTDAYRQCGVVFTMGDDPVKLSELRFKCPIVVIADRREGTV